MIYGTIWIWILKLKDMIINTSAFPEFELACDILYIRPHEAIEAFMNSISLAYLYSTDRYLSQRIDDPNLPIVECSVDDTKNYHGLGNNPTKFIASNFLVTHCSLFYERFLPVQKVQKRYINKFKRLKSELKKETNEELRYFLLIGFYNDWHRELIENMSENDAIIDVRSKRDNLIKK